MTFWVVVAAQPIFFPLSSGWNAIDSTPTDIRAQTYLMTAIFQKVAPSRPKGLKAFHSWKAWSTQNLSDSLSQGLSGLAVSALAVAFWEESTPLQAAATGVPPWQSLPFGQGSPYVGTKGMRWAQNWQWCWHFYYCCEKLERNHQINTDVF